MAINDALPFVGC